MVDLLAGGRYVLSSGSSRCKLGDRNLGAAAIVAYKRVYCTVPKIKKEGIARFLKLQTLWQHKTKHGGKRKEEGKKRKSCVLSARSMAPICHKICCKCTFLRRVALLLPRHPRSYYPLSIPHFSPHVSYSPYFHAIQFPTNF